MLLLLQSPQARPSRPGPTSLELRAAPSRGRVWHPAAPAPEVQAERRGLLQALAAALAVSALAALAPAALPTWLGDLALAGVMALPVALLATFRRAR